MKIQAIEVLVTRTRSGDFRARMRWNDGGIEREHRVTTSGLIATLMDAGREMLALMEGWGR